MWWKGPDFLPGETIICPPQPVYTNNAPEQRTTAKIHESKVTKASQIFLKQPWHYETKSNDIAEAKRFVFRESQKEDYTEEYTILRDGEELSKKEFPTQSGSLF